MELIGNNTDLDRLNAIINDLETPSKKPLTISQVLGLGGEEPVNIDIKEQLEVARERKRQLLHTEKTNLKSLVDNELGQPKLDELKKYRKCCPEEYRNILNSNKGLKTELISTRNNLISEINTLEVRYASQVIEMEGKTGEELSGLRDNLERISTQISTKQKAQSDYFIPRPRGTDTTSDIKMSSMPSFNLFNDMDDAQKMNEYMKIYKERKNKERTEKNNKAYLDLINGHGNFIGLPTGYKDPKYLFETYGLPTNHDFINEDKNEDIDISKMFSSEFEVNMDKLNESKYGTYIFYLNLYNLYNG